MNAKFFTWMWIHMSSFIHSNLLILFHHLILFLFLLLKIWDIIVLWASLRAQMVKTSIQETRNRSLGREDPLEEGMATHSSVLAWRIPWSEESVGLQSMGSMSCWFLLYYNQYDKTVLFFFITKNSFRSWVFSFYILWICIIPDLIPAINYLPVWATLQQGKIRRYGITWFILISDTVIR